MHDLEPYYKWRRYYIASEDKLSPYYNKVYDEFKFTNKVYNYYVHPQWDSFGSQTLYAKVLIADYSSGIAFIELIGEWNDILYNDIMLLKTNLINPLIDNSITKYIILCDNVLNYHGDDNSYYEEWWDDIKEDNGMICFVNTLLHVTQEMERAQLQYYVNFGGELDDIDWQRYLPPQVVAKVMEILNNTVKQLDY